MLQHNYNALQCRPYRLTLDEPTNHLGIAGKTSLEAQLTESNATLLITSHDRRFVDAVANRFVLIADGQLGEIDSPRNFYARMLNRARPATAPTAAAPTASSRETASEEAMLERLVELETVLEEDLARKP